MASLSALSSSSKFAAQCRDRRGLAAARQCRRGPAVHHGPRTRRQGTHAKTRAEAANPKNDNGNPFQCLRDLAAQWPTPDPAKLRAVLMFTDGIIRSNGQIMVGGANGEQMNPDVSGASQLLQREGSSPIPSSGRTPSSRTPTAARAVSSRDSRTSRELASETRAAQPSKRASSLQDRSLLCSTGYTRHCRARQSSP